MGPQALNDRISQHYHMPNLATAILQALQESGKNPNRLDVKDLAPVDQFHTGGRHATLELAQRAGIDASSKVLDLGGGLGGSARTLAAEFGCEVTVLDLTPVYAQTGELLTRRCGLEHKVRFVTGNALQPPFPAASFDLVWLQHCSMNIADKARLFGEIALLLRPGGRLALHEVVAHSNRPPHFPLPWAAEPGSSFLQPAEDMRTLLAAAGLTEAAWLDASTAAARWFRNRLASLPDPLPPLGLQLLLGDRFRPALENMLRNLEEGRIAVVAAVLERA